MPRNESIDLDRDYEPENYDRDEDDYAVAQSTAEFGERRNPRREKRSRIPAHAPRPQDHKPKAKKKAKKSPQQREAEGIETVDVEFDGEVYEIPADPIDWGIDVTEAFETGRVITACRGLLGTQQFATLSSKGYRNRDFQRLFKRLAEAGGFESLAK